MTPWLKKLIEGVDTAKDAASRLERIKHLGFDPSKTWYHGTKANIEKFDPAALGSSTNAQSAKKGFFFASDPRTAGDYADLALHPVERAVYDGWEEAEYATNEYRNTLIDTFGEDYHKHAPKPYLDELARLSGEDHKYRIAALNLSKLADAGTEQQVNDIAHNIAKSAGYNDQIREAMSRLGQDRDYYHPEFDKYKIKSSKAAMKALYENTREAKKLVPVSSWEELQKSQQVLPVHLRMERPLVHDFKGSEYRDTTYAELLSRARAQGNDSVSLQNTYDPGGRNKILENIGVVFEPHQIRSVNAKFNPAARRSSNILDSAVPVALAGEAAAAGNTWASDLQNPIETGALDSISSGLKALDAHTTQPIRGGMAAGLKGQNVWEGMRDNFGGKGVSADELAQMLLERTPNMGMPGVEGGYPLQGAVSLGVDTVLDPTNLIGAGLATKGVKAGKSGWAALAKLLK